LVCLVEVLVPEEIVLDLDPVVLETAVLGGTDLEDFVV
jgi:hypothetical protein